MLPHRYRKQGAEMLSTLGLNCCVPEASDFFFSVTEEYLT